MSESEQNVCVYDEYGGPHVGRVITVEVDGEVEFRFMNIGNIALVPQDQADEWLLEALVENGYEYYID